MILYNKLWRKSIRTLLLIWLFRGRTPTRIWLFCTDRHLSHIGSSSLTKSRVRLPLALFLHGYVKSGTGGEAVLGNREFRFVRRSGRRLRRISAGGLSRRGRRRLQRISAGGLSRRGRRRLRRKIGKRLSRRSRRRLRRISASGFRGEADGDCTEYRREAFAAERARRHIYLINRSDKRNRSRTRPVSFWRR